MTKRLEGKAATQQKILIAATEIFMELGYEGATMQAVAEAAEVSRATVFWHFGDKAGLFREAFSRLLDPFRESLEREFTDLAPEKRLQEQLAMSERFAAEHGNEIAAFMRWAFENPDHRMGVVTTLLDLNQRFAGALTQSIAALVPADVDPKQLAQVLMLAFDANLLLSMFDTRPEAAEERRASIQAYVESIARGGGHGGGEGGSP